MLTRRSCLVGKSSMVAKMKLSRLEDASLGLTYGLWLVLPKIISGEEYR